MTTAEERAAASQRFFEAVHAGARGDFTLCDALVQRVRDRFGEQAAQMQRRELWNTIRRASPRFNPGKLK